MAIWNVKAVLTGDVSGDGQTISIKVDLGAGRTGTINLPYTQADQLAQGVMYLAGGAYDRQVASGQLPAVTLIADAPVADGVSCLADPAAGEAILQLLGRKDPNGPLGIAAVRLPETLCRETSRKLSEVADQIRQRQRPS